MIAVKLIASIATRNLSISDSAIRIRPPSISRPSDFQQRIIILFHLSSAVFASTFACKPAR